MMIDFWGTWCPPCQKPMAHNHHMATTNKDKWDGKVRIIGLPLDQDVATVKAKVEGNKWGDVEHYQKGGSSGPNDWGIQGIPHCALIDKSGKITWRGHPQSVDL